MSYAGAFEANELVVRLVNFETIKTQEEAVLLKEDSIISARGNTDYSKFRSTFFNS